LSLDYNTQKNNTMKKTMLLMLPFFVAIVAIAQPPHPAGKPGKGPGGKAGMEMMKDIDLTPEQKVAMQKLQDELRQQMQALNRNESITVKEQRDRREALLEKTQRSGRQTADSRSEKTTGRQTCQGPCQSG
jgi:hypothetical protein